MFDIQLTIARLAFNKELVSIGVEELRANRSNVWETSGSNDSNDGCRNESSKRKGFGIHCCSTVVKDGYRI